MGRNHRVVQGAMPAGGAAGCHHYRGHRAQGGCTAHGAAYGQRAAFFGSILIEEEATIPTVKPRRNHIHVAVTAEPAPTAASWRFGDKTASPATNTRWLLCSRDLHASYKIRGQGPGLVTSLVFFPCFIMQKILFSGRSTPFRNPSHSLL